MLTCLSEWKVGSQKYYLIIFPKFTCKIGLIFDNSLTTSDEPLDEISELCHDENYRDKKHKVMINVTKRNPKSTDMDIYASTAIFTLFPKVGSTIFEMGKAEGGYWDVVI